ncbi:oligosaccharide flippase family protein [Aestuariivivens sediminis]|uniref:oligosaccharide flippase family protein n=1 Tax=Aestuariivivens sediminis TaxID=2913557 RepID=UPI001F589D5A|nr:oligosaccharide flippase family protein [Aestuariivivens sediminis]
MKTESNSYKQIIKATSLFGGVQSITILVSILKTKAAALLIGVSGVGIFGVLMSTLNLIQALTRCGIDVTAVKEIASSEKEKQPQLVKLILKITLITAILGALIILIGSPLLSQLAFNHKSYTSFFIIVSMAILFNQLATGNLAILQGLRSLKNLAKVITLSSVLSLIPTVGIYYFFGEKGIPWVIVTTAGISFFVSNYYIKQLKISAGNYPLKKLIETGKTILKPGLYLSLASIMALAIAYIIQVYITNTGGVEEVGLYNAGFALIHSYVAIFFSALSKDFFPRLSKVSQDSGMVNKTVNEQAYILLLLITPLIVIFLAIKPFIVTLLYSKAFLPILGMITYGMLSTAFKSVSWSMGFMLLAKGDSKLYFITELITHLVLLTFVVAGYQIYGLTGIGIGFLVYHILDLLFIKWIVTKNYGFKFDLNFNNLFYVCIFQFLIMVGLLFIDNGIIKHTIMILVILCSLCFTLFKLNNHFNFFDRFKHD